MTSRKHTVETAIGPIEVENARSAPRYAIEPPLVGDLNGAEVRVRNISTGGIGISSTAQAKVGSNNLLIIDNPEFGEKLRFRCEVLWCRATGEKAENGALLYLAGLRHKQPLEEIAGPLGRLIRFSGREDKDSFTRKIEAVAKRHLTRAMADVTMPATINTDQILKVERAIMAIGKGTANVDDLVAMARSEMEKKQLTAAESREVLAIWAYLDFEVPMKSIGAIRAGLESIR